MPNGEKTRRTLLNGTSIFGGEALARSATFLMAVIVARRFGAEALGQYGYAVALASILLLVPDLGLHLLTTRELAADPARLRRIFWSVHWLKMILLGAVVLFTGIFGEFVVRDDGRRWLLYILVARIALQTFSLAYMAIFKAFERMHYIAIAQFANALAVIACATFALTLGARIEVLISSFLVGQVLETWLGWHLVRRRFPPGEVFGWDRPALAEMLVAAAPIGATALLQALNLRLDLLVLSVFQPNQELGRFQAAAWFLTGTYLFAALGMSVLFPRLSRLLHTPSSRGGAYVESLLKHGILLITLGSVVVAFAAPVLLRAIFGAPLAPAAGVLRILAPALPFVFMNTVLFYVFVAARRRTVYLGTIAAGVVLGTILGFVLAPRFAATGSALACLGREFVMTAVFLYFLKRQALAPAIGQALLKATLVAAMAGFASPVVEWPAALSVIMFVATLTFAGLPNLRELLLLAEEG